MAVMSPPRYADKMNLVVVGVDEGPHSQAAFEKAITVFPRDTTQFHIVYVRPVQPVVEEEGSEAKDYWEQLEGLRRAQSQAVLDKFRQVASDAGLSFTIVELQGDAREELCDYCHFHKAGILVLGSRGSSFLQRMFLGSVSQYCLHHAPCAVLVDRHTADSMDVPNTSEGSSHQTSVES